LAGWCVVRMVVAATWRDVAVLGPLRAEQVVALLVATGAAIGAALLALRRGAVPAPGVDVR